MTFDVATIRKQYPTLQQDVEGRRLVYLDSAASSQTPEAVLDAMDVYYRRLRANVERGVYRLSEEATGRYEAARQRLAEFVGAPSPDGVVFTRNVTEAINLVAYSWVRRRLGPGDAILTTAMEHHANFVPWWHAAQDTGVELRIVPVREDFHLDVEVMQSMLADGKVRFLALGHVSNVLGTINPLRELVALARAANPEVVVLVDGAQAVPHLPVDVASLDVDFYGITGHKMLGPTGIGLLYGKHHLLKSMPPFQGGGEMVDKVSFEKTTFEDPPHRFEAGTPAIADAIGLGAAIDYLEGVGMETIAAWDRALVQYAEEKLRAFPGIRIIGEAPEKSGLVAFVHDTMHPFDLGTILDRAGVAIRVGHHCAQPVMAHFGVTATARISFQLYNTREDIDRFMDGLAMAADMLA